MKKPGTKTIQRSCKNPSSNYHVEKSRPFPLAGWQGWTNTHRAGEEKYGEKQEPGQVQTGGWSLGN